MLMPTRTLLVVPNTILVVPKAIDVFKYIGFGPIRTATLRVKENDRITCSVWCG